MQRVSVLNVGHGLCVVVGQSNNTLVFDCGEHSLRRPVPLSSKRLADRIRPYDQISEIAVSHLHFDHYCGFLKPLPNVRSNVEFYVGRMPRINNDPALGNEFVLRLMTIAPLDPQYGPLDLDLIRRVRKSAPNLVPKPVSRGESFSSGGENWNVLWPPTDLESSDWQVKSVQRAIEAYDDAAKTHEWLAERLASMRTSDTYRVLLDELDGSRDSDARDHVRSHRAEEHLGNSDLAIREPHDSDGLLAKAGRLLRRAANHLSLVLLSTNGILLTGDASRSAMHSALGQSYRSCSIVIAPHHGGKSYVPAVVKKNRLHSRIWVSSAGGRLSPYVAAIYGTLGSHFRTDHDCNVELYLRAGRIHHVAIGCRPPCEHCC